MPLFVVGELISKKVLDEIITIAKNINIDKQKEQEIESLDVMVYDFISRQEGGLTFCSVKDLANRFREFSDESAEWLNSKWFGRALKRLNLVINKRRKGYGVEVILNVLKAREKMRMFKPREKPKNDTKNTNLQKM